MTRFAQRFVFERVFAAGGMACVVLGKDEFDTWTLVNEGAEWKISDTDALPETARRSY